MFEKLLKLYVMAIHGDVRSPMPHLIGPPGCGKSTVVQQLADHLGVTLHIINVSRISPLELEGVQMPVSEKDKAMKLQLLHATFWTQLKEGDILLLDEFLRGFPEVYNGLLDILTSRQVGGLKLPKVFILGASNSKTSYDKALDDRLLHLPVPDPRKRKAERTAIAEMVVAELGLHPDMVGSGEMTRLLDRQVLPMYNIMDTMMGKGGTGAAPSADGKSIRNLIGQAKLREVQTDELSELITVNNARAARDKKWQFVLLLNGKAVPAAEYEGKIRTLLEQKKLIGIQESNAILNLQLIEMEKIRQVKGINDDDDDVFIEPDFN